MTNPKNGISWLSGFGESKEYRCYALRCSADILYCARQLEILCGLDCSFVGEMQVTHEPPLLNGMVFASVLDKSKNAFLYLLPNKYSVEIQSSGGGDLFTQQDGRGDYYLFSKKGEKKFKSERAGYEYLVMLCADIGYEFQEVEERLQRERRLPVEVLTDRLLQRPEVGKESAVSLFLKRLFISLELEFRKFEKSQVEQFLGDVLSVSVSNFVFKPFMELEPEVQDDYLTREDI